MQDSKAIHLSAPQNVSIFQARMPDGRQARVRLVPEQSFAKLVTLEMTVPGALPLQLAVAVDDLYDLAAHVALNEALKSASNETPPLRLLRAEE